GAHSDPSSAVRIVTGGKDALLPGASKHPDPKRCRASISIRWAADISRSRTRAGWLPRSPGDAILISPLSCCSDFGWPRLWFREAGLSEPTHQREMTPSNPWLPFEIGPMYGRDASK